MLILSSVWLNYICEPWARSNDGATDGVVLRIKEVAEAGEETDLKLSTLAETYKQVYDDLDEALRYMRFPDLPVMTFTGMLPLISVSRMLRWLMPFMPVLL